jgi:hypothetical protein
MVEIPASRVPKTFPELYAWSSAKVNAQNDNFSEIVLGNRVRTGWFRMFIAPTSMTRSPGRSRASARIDLFGATGRTG